MKYKKDLMYDLIKYYGLEGHPELQLEKFLWESTWPASLIGYKPKKVIRFLSHPPRSIFWPFEEAHRRLHMGGLASDQPIETAWVGLGYPSDYKDAVRAGYFRPLHGDNTPRILHWYQFTQKGLNRYRQMAQEGAFNGSR